MAGVIVGCQRQARPIPRPSRSLPGNRRKKFAARALVDLRGFPSLRFSAQLSAARTWPRRETAFGGIIVSFGPFASHRILASFGRQPELPLQVEDRLTRAKYGLIQRGACEQLQGAMNYDTILRSLSAHMVGDGNGR